MFICSWLDRGLWSAPLPYCKSYQQCICLSKVSQEKQVKWRPNIKPRPHTVSSIPGLHPNYNQANPETLRTTKTRVILFLFSNYHIQVFCDEGFQSWGDCSLSYQRHRFPVCINELPTIWCNISPSQHRSKRLLNCDQIILTNMTHLLPPKESVCQQSCNLFSPIIVRRNLFSQDSVWHS